MKRTNKPRVIDDWDWTEQEYFEKISGQPILKRRIIQQVVQVMLENEAFLQAYPDLYEPEKAEQDEAYREKACRDMAFVIAGVWRKNHVKSSDAAYCASMALESYSEWCSHSVKSMGRYERADTAEQPVARQ